MCIYNYLNIFEYFLFFYIYIVRKRKDKVTNNTFDFANMFYSELKDTPQKNKIKNVKLKH